MLAILVFVAWLVSPCISLNDVAEVSADVSAFFDEENQKCSAGDAQSCALSLLQHKAVAKKRRTDMSQKQGGKLADVMLAEGSNTSNSTMVSARYTVKGDGFEAVVNDEFYISLLQKVPVFGGQNLYESLNPTWSKSPVYGEAYDHFPTTGLFLWGSEKSDALFILIPGTSGLCVQYAATLASVASNGYFVVCPQMSFEFGQAEVVMKPVCAVEWAFSRSKYSSVVIAGHSGGAAATPAAARQLISRGVSVQAIIMTHAGLVPFLNTPGCEKYVLAHLNIDSNYGATRLEYCRRFYPEDLLSSLRSLKVLLIEGNFCQWSTAQNSNWLEEYKCVSADSEECSTKDVYIPAPHGGPNLPVRCGTGLCPAVSFLENPGDCMKNTFNAGSYIATGLLEQTSNEVAHLKVCSDHGYGVLGPLGAIGDGAVLAEYARQLSSAKEVRQQWLQSLNQSKQTCHVWENTNERCIIPLTPFSTEFKSLYHTHSGFQLCSEARKISIVGQSSVFYRGEAKQ